MSLSRLKPFLSSFRFPAFLPKWPDRPIQWLLEPASLAPLAAFRVLFGLMMVVSIVRFWAMGWIESLYLQPSFHFTYLGFDWISVLPGPWMHGLFALMAFSALTMALGFCYRISTLIFFLSFTYVELLDKTYYLNHYYFVSLVALLMIFLPAHRRFSVDAWWRPSLQRSEAPRWMTQLIRFQLGLVYVYAGVAKLNADWLLEAMPLAIWLPANYHLPVIGPYFDQKWMVYGFSWAGAAYDLLIPFFLIQRFWRPMAYGAVVVFHLMTGWLFQIGMFPYIMIAATLVFFPAAFHQRWMTACTDAAGRLGRSWKSIPAAPEPPADVRMRPIALFAAGLFVLFQLLYPWRYLLYDGHLFWHEQGYRFGWRVMLIEKTGYATFYIKDGSEGRETIIDNSQFLTPNQEKMMSTQPDMILQYAHHLDAFYRDHGYENPHIRAEVYASLNGRRSRLLIDPYQELTDLRRGWAPKPWILPLEPAYTDPSQMAHQR